MGLLYWPLKLKCLTEYNVLFSQVSYLSLDNYWILYTNLTYSLFCHCFSYSRMPTTRASWRRLIWDAVHWSQMSGSDGWLKLWNTLHISIQWGFTFSTTMKMKSVMIQQSLIIVAWQLTELEKEFTSIFKCLLCTYNCAFLYFPILPVFCNWCNESCGMYIKDILLLIRKSALARFCFDQTSP